MRIHMPEFTSAETLRFTNHLSTLDFSKESEVIYDYSHMSRFEPFAMLVISSAIRRIIRKNRNCEHIDSDFKKHTYAGTMGYFQSVNQDYGKKPGEAHGSSNYIPMTRMKIADLHKVNENESIHINELIEAQSRKLAKVLSCGNSDVISTLTYILREIIRNIVEHSESDDIWIAGQYWPSKDSVEIAILDEGMGIKKSLKSNRYYKHLIKSDKDALQLSILPGVTRAFRRVRPNMDDVWDNSGFGLYVTSELCDDLSGCFILLSGDCSIVKTDRKLKYREAYFDGTAIGIRISTKHIGDINKRIRDIVKNGEAKSKKMSRIAMEQASSASKQLSLSKLLEE